MSSCQHCDCDHYEDNENSEGFFDEDLVEKLLASFARVCKYDEAGGGLHVIIMDGNLDCVDWCREHHEEYCKRKAQITAERECLTLLEEASTADRWEAYRRFHDIRDK